MAVRLQITCGILRALTYRPMSGWLIRAEKRG
ncbi:uncharacterized protein METZ01_LOCUS292161, partial [marine metagenome]